MSQDPFTALDASVKTYVDMQDAIRDAAAEHDQERAQREADQRVADSLTNLGQELPPGE